MTNFTIRYAKSADIPQVVRLFAMDQLGKQREIYQDPLPECYYQAFYEIDTDKNNHLIVLETDQNIIGTLHV